MKSKPSASAPDALIFSRRDEDPNRWTCIECETENDAVCRACALCGAPWQEMPAEKPAAAPFARPRSTYEQPATQFHPGISEPVSADKPGSRADSFLRRNWLRIAALLVVLGVGAYLLIHFYDYEHTLTLSDGSRLVFSKSYGDITGAEYYSSDSVAAGELRCSDDYSEAEYAVFFSDEMPVEFVYFTGSGEDIAIESRRELEYKNPYSLISSTLYDADGLTLSRDEYFPGMVFEDGEYRQLETLPEDVSASALPVNIDYYDPVLDNDFSRFVCSRRSEYADGRLSVIHEYDEQGRKTAQTNCDPSGEPLEVLEYEYTDSGRISYRCSTDRKRLSATEPDGKYWTYHYNDNNEFLNRTRLVEYIDWDYSSERISLANYELNYIRLAETIYSCSQFCYSFQVDSVSYGKVEGKFKIFVRNDKGRWSSVKTFSYSKKDGAFPEVGGSVQLDTPMNITGFAFLPSTAKTLSWGSYESTFNYVILDKNY